MGLHLLDAQSVSSLTETLVATSRTPAASPSAIETLVATDIVRHEDRPTILGDEPARSTAGRTTVLPRVVTAQRGELRLVPHDRSRYTPVRRLGQGAMGEVELSEDHDIGRRVAVKRMSDGVASPVLVARFVDEVRTMGSLDHPNITPIYDVGRDDDGRLFFTMKYVDGESLESLIDRLAAGDAQAHAQYPLARRLDVFVGIVHALDCAHAQGILHRDIKPANVMLGRHGEVRLMDWGIARRGARALGPTEGESSDRPDMTQHGSLLGTPLYMSPEQASGDLDALDARSDLYSAFVVLFELLTLRRYVREEDTVLATLHEVLHGDEDERWRDVSVWSHPAQPPVPIELRHFLRRGLRRDPAQRFSGAVEVLMELEALRSGSIHVECPVTYFKAQQTRVSRFADAKPHVFLGLAGAIGASMLGVLTLAGYGLMTLVS